MKYELIIFDADETLFDFKRSEKYAFENSILELGFEYNEAYHPIYTQINSAIWKEFEKELITQDVLKVERFRRLSDKLKIDFDALEFSKLYARHLSSASFLFDFSEELIHTLSENYKLIMITNGLKSVQENRIRKSTIAKYFEDIIVSEEVGISKPNPKIFEYALRNHKHIDKSKILMVGDSLTSDVQGGFNYGIDTCWYNPNKALNNSAIKPTFELECLTMLTEQ